MFYMFRCSDSGDSDMFKFKLVCGSGWSPPRVSCGSVDLCFDAATEGAIVTISAKIELIR